MIAQNSDAKKIGHRKSKQFASLVTIIPHETWFRQERL